MCDLLHPRYDKIHFTSNETEEGLMHETKHLKMHDQKPIPKENTSIKVKAKSTSYQPLPEF